MAVALAAGEEARAAGTVVLHTGSVATSANADARCEHEGTGDVDGNVAGDSTSPYAARSLASVTLPCTHGARRTTTALEGTRARRAQPRPDRSGP